MIVRARAQHDPESRRHFFRSLLEVIDDLGLRHLSRHIQVALEAVLRGNVRKEFVDVRRSDFPEHLLTVGGRFWKIAHGFRFLRLRKLVMQG